jgi:predicted flap endonuclease-1-like 5' DNA nuclease
MFEQDVTLGPGSGTYTEHSLEIFIMLLGAFLLGLWLGWLIWNRFKQMYEKMRLENQSLTATADALRLDLDGVKGRLTTADNELANFNTQVASLNRNNANLRDRVAELESELSDTQDRNFQVENELGLTGSSATTDGSDIELEIIDPIEIDIEPTIIEVSEEVAIDTPVLVIEEPVVEVLEEKLELVTSPTVVTTSIAPVVDLTATTPIPDPEPTPIAVVASEKDDLTVVEGIGPKIQMLLNQYGIQTYRQLANTDTARLKEILQSAGPQLAMHDPGTWPSQANLAANDEWDNLKSIQGFLKGGKKPT